ncbi:hypothetical protein ABD83_00670 [Bacillus xiamenensis]|nr:hypothetical protein BA1_06417 [Bacillus xiamenensis]MBG9910007.1 hypothetical protein [Bacillus xiamenensis]
MVINVRVIAVMLLGIAEESPCSHGAEMPVVFVPGEKISQGSLGKADGRKNAYVLLGYGKVSLKVPQ